MELTLDQALLRGIEAHKAGKAQKADQYYTAILKANPKHPDANHNMGVLAVGVGKVEAALPFFKTALEVDSTIAQYWLSYIDALIKLDRFADAKAVFDQAKSKGARGDGFDKLKIQLSSSLPIPIPLHRAFVTRPSPELLLRQAHRHHEHRTEQDAHADNAPAICPPPLCCTSSKSARRRKA